MGKVALHPEHHFSGWVLIVQKKKKVIAVAKLPPKKFVFLLNFHGEEF